MLKILVKEKNTTDAWESLYLPENIEFTYKLTNPALTDMGDFSYPITVNYELNKHIFKFPSEGEWIDREFEFQLYFGEDRFIVGDVEIINADGIEFSLKSGNSAVSNVLNDSFLDDQINGKSWGEETPRPSGYFFGKASSYPNTNYCTPIIQGEDSFIFNQEEYFYFTLGLIKNTICPAVYVRYLMNRIVWALGYNKDHDAMEGVEDLNRLYVFAARTPGVNYQYKDWMPHISAMEFLRSIRERFGFFINFDPLTKIASIKSVNHLLSKSSINITAKLVSITSSERYRKKTILLSHGEFPESEDETNIDDIIHKAQYSTSLPLPNPALYPYAAEEDDEGLLLRIPQGDSIYRVFKKTKIKGKDKHAYFSKESPDLDFYGFKTTSTPPDKDEESIVSSSSATPRSYISSNIYFVARFNISAEIMSAADDLTILKAIIDVKKNAGNTKLIVVLGGPYNSHIVNFNPFNTLIAYTTIDVNNSSFETKSILFRVREARMAKQNRGCALWFFSYHASSANSVSIRFGGTSTSSGVGSIPSHLVLEPTYFEWKEVGKIGNYRLGEKIDPDEEIKPSGAIMTNKYLNNLGYFEAPYYPYKSEEKQEKYGFSILRGLVDEPTLFDISFDRTSLIFSSFDKKTIDQKAFDLNENGSDLSLTLRWREPKGIVNSLLSNHLMDRQHKFRPVTALLNFTYFDLITFDITQPVMLNAQRYLFEELSLPISNRGIGEITAELVTI